MTQHAKTNIPQPTFHHQQHLTQFFLLVAPTQMIVFHHHTSPPPQFIYFPLFFQLCFDNFGPFHDRQRFPRNPVFLLFLHGRCNVPHVGDIDRPQHFGFAVFGRKHLDHQHGTVGQQHQVLHLFPTTATDHHKRLVQFFQMPRRAQQQFMGQAEGGVVGQQDSFL